MPCYVLIALSLALICSNIIAIDTEVLAEPEQLNRNESNIIKKNKLPKGSDYKIFCYDSSTDFDVTKIWSPLTVSIFSDNNAWVRVKHAATDNLHTIIDSQIQKALGISASKDIRDRLVEKESFLFFPKPTILTECPSILWSANKSQCTLHLSPFGESCISVASRSFQDSKPSYFTVETSRGFQKRLMYFFIAGMLLLIMSHEMSKSKIFQYSAGALAGTVAGLLLVVLFALRKKKGIASSPLVLAVLYFGSVYLTVKEYATVLVASYWEYLLAYFAFASFVGLVLTHWLRSDPHIKHRTRVIVKWLIRMVGFVFLFQSTFSWYVEAMWFVVLIFMYINHKATKSSRKKKNQGKKD